MPWDFFPICFPQEKSLSIFIILLMIIDVLKDMYFIIKKDANTFWRRRIQIHRATLKLLLKLHVFNLMNNCFQVYLKCMLKNHNILTLRINTTNISNFSSNAAIYCHAGPLYPFTYLEVKIREVKCRGSPAVQTLGYSITLWQLIIRLDTSWHITEGEKIPPETKVL